MIELGFNNSRNLTPTSVIIGNKAGPEKLGRRMASVDEGRTYRFGNRRFRPLRFALPSLSGLHGQSSVPNDGAHPITPLASMARTTSMSAGSQSTLQSVSRVSQRASLCSRSLKEPVSEHRKHCMCRMNSGYS